MYDKKGRRHHHCETPKLYSLAAQSGYHVISLAYPGLTNMYSSYIIAGDLDLVFRLTIL